MNKLITSYIIVVVFSLLACLFNGSVYADTMEYKTMSITTNGEIDTVSEQNDTLYVGGTFSEIQIENTEPVKRNNIAAISISKISILPWNPEISIEVHTIEFKDDSVIAKNYVESEPDTGDRKEVIIHPVTGAVTQSEFVTAVSTEAPVPQAPVANTEPTNAEVQGLMVDREALGFEIPTLSNILTFSIRGFFVLAGLAALFFLLIGAFTWITSGGDKDSVQAAKDKMQAAIVGVLMMVVVLAIVWTLEQVVLGKAICFGISCPVTLPTLLEPTT